MLSTAISSFQYYPALCTALELFQFNNILRYA